MKPILVTGGAGGLGAAVCLELAAQGFDIVVHYRTSQPQAEQIVRQCRSLHVEAEAIQGDFSTQESLNHFISSYISHFPLTCGLVNNVGYYLVAPLEETSQDKWLALFQTNFFASIFLTQALLPALKIHRGNIVNVGVSGLEGRRGVTQTTAFATSKAALHFYTISLAKEVAAAGVRVNMVSPGFMENTVDKVTQLPMHRLATLKEVAQAISTFFLPQSNYITGQNLEIAGAFGL
jgi:NAD(P)-dependent dehydrogenase (short-subunit alcohol dehydrogenase family)